MVIAMKLNTPFHEIAQSRLPIHSRTLSIIEMPWKIIIIPLVTAGRHDREKSPSCVILYRSTPFPPELRELA